MASHLTITGISQARKYLCSMSGSAGVRNTYFQRRLEFVDEIHTVRARPASRRQFCRGFPGRSPAPPCVHHAFSHLFVAALRCWYSG